MDSSLFMKGNKFFRGIGTAKNEEMARILYTEASKLGNADAIAMLGLMHERGLGGLAPNDSLALEYHRRAAQRSIATAV